jgi:hypothetical protein
MSNKDALNFQHHFISAFLINRILNWKLEESPHQSIGEYMYSGQTKSSGKMTLKWHCIEDCLLRVLTGIVFLLFYARLRIQLFEDQFSYLHWTLQTIAMVRMPTPYRYTRCWGLIRNQMRHSWHAQRNTRKTGVHICPPSNSSLPLLKNNKVDWSVFDDWPSQVIKASSQGYAVIILYSVFHSFKCSSSK